ncbi:MAG TPA: AAA family ATPase, partial [Planctomycetota bacterium]|nr:AAA family ATPase [Planctomycetota bacterium]
QMLVLGAKARALLHNRFHVATEDIDALAKPVLRHRVVPTFAAQAAGLDPDKIIERLIAARAKAAAA